MKIIIVMGVCQSNANSKRKMSSSSQYFEKSQNSNDNNTNASSVESEALYCYHCGVKNKEFTIAMNEFDSAKLPCGCVRRRDISMEKFKEKMNNEGVFIKTMCKKHNKEMNMYCYECEMEICDFCKLLFHNEYFSNHHIIMY